LQEQLSYQQTQLEELRRQRATQDQRLDEVQTELESTRRTKNDFEYRAGKIEEENAKMHKNYEVLKEHELCIIRDF